MEDKFSQQLKKGVLEMLVLKLVCDGPTYGYQLLTRLKEESGGRFTLKEGTLYPILYRLEDESGGGSHSAKENVCCHRSGPGGKCPPHFGLAGIYGNRQWILPGG